MNTLTSPEELLGSATGSYEAGMQDAFTTVEGQAGLPRYFAPVFRTLCRAERGRLDIVLPDGRRFRVEGAAPGHVAEVHVHDPDIFARTIREGDLGFCDAYLEGDWSTPDLQALMDWFAEDAPAAYDGFPGQGLVRLFEKFRHWLNRNTKTQARKNISYHYDLGNDFYRLWLDDTMTYSSALFETGQESLEAAQTAKYARMVDQIGAKPGDHVLEIGCGWGGFAEYAARERGLRVTGLTISQEQLKFARDRIERAGLSDRVELKLQDYRDERGTYDGIASIEMFEAVGEKYWPTYFETVRRCLKPGGRGTFQIILVQDERFETYRKQVDFIQKYIFPGGMLPGPTVLRRRIEGAGLRVADDFRFGPSYDLTLRRWHEAFLSAWDRIAAMGFDARFKRMWEFYLTSCASAFKSATTDVTQITVTRPA